MHTTAPIRLLSLTTGYDHRPVTNDINATLRRGELTCLLGPNGAGKSTLLKTLCGFIPPLAGEIFINGEPSRRYSARTLAQTIGVVLTDRPSAINMTVEELVGIGRTPYTSFFGSLRRSDKAIIDQAISLVGIESLRTRNIVTLSDGERQKALIAKAIAQQTEIVILDEPTAFLDYPSKAELLKLLYRIAHDEGKTIFLSTHDLELALQTADRLWLLDKSHGLNIGIPEDLACSGALNRYFRSEGLKFNPHTGLFEIKHKKRGSITLSGHGDLYYMVRKALNRIGIEATEAQNAEIEVTDETIHYQGRTLQSIQQLIESLSAGTDQ